MVSFQFLRNQVATKLALISDSQKKKTCREIKLLYSIQKAQD